MPSRLSSLLVRDGLVGVKRMEAAFQRQVIFGGGLDTTLLEMGLVAEERLVQYLSLATGIPPAEREETEAIDEDAARRCPREVAERFQVVPVAMIGDALRTLVKEPVDLALLEDLADWLATPIQPLIVPEYRFYLVRDQVYGLGSSARYLALARLQIEDPSATPVGKPRTVIVDPRVQPPALVELHEAALAPPSKPKKRITKELSSDALMRDLEKTEEARKVAAVHAPKAVVVPPPAVARGGELVAPDAPPEPPPVTEDAGDAVADAVPLAPLAGADTPLLHGPEGLASPGARGMPPSAQAAPMPARRHWQRDLSIDAEPISMGEAMTALAEAGDRDAVFGALLRAIRGRTWYAGLLTVQGAAAVGRVAIAGSRVDSDEIAQVLIPLDIDSAFTKVVRTQSPYIGPVATGHADVDAMIRRMGGMMPRAALLMPIALRGRVIAIAVGHRGGENVGVTEVSGLLPLATAAAETLSRLIVRAKGGGYRAPATSTPPPPIHVDELPSRGDIEGRATGRWRRPDTEEPAPEIELSTELSAPNENIDDVLAAIEGDDEAVAQKALGDALRRPRDTAAALRDRFPGRLRVDRFEVGGRALRADQHGPLLGLAVKLGGACGDVLVDKMREGSRDVRYYAVLCAAESRPKAALPALVERLFDSDYGVRETAVRALAGYAVRDLDSALDGARRALHAEDVQVAQAAAHAIAQLTDLGAMNDLLDATSRNDAGADAARRALVVLSRQDFGTSTKRWRQWWNDHKQRHRIEWLIDALAHKDESMRRDAFEDLRRISGEELGYKSDQSRRERDEARERWLHWWNAVGKRRFAREADPERHRPTGVLPRHPHE